MKTLHKIFQKRFFKKLLKLDLLLVGLFFLITIIDEKNSNEFLKLIYSLSALTIFSLPFAILFMEGYFPKNIKFLINQNFSRKELLNFFLVSQTIRILLFVSHYLLYIIIADRYYQSSKAAKIVESIQSTSGPILASDLFFWYGVIICLFYALYIFTLTKIHGMDLERIKNNQRSGGLTLRFYLMAIFAFIILSVIIAKYSVPTIIFVTLFTFLIMAYSFKVFNDIFKVVSTTKIRNYYILCGAIFSLPFLILGIQMNAQAHDQSIPYKDRISSVVYLGVLNSKFSNEEMIEFLDSSTELDYGSLLTSFADDLSAVEALKTVYSKEEIKEFLDHYSFKQSDKDLRRIILKISNLLIGNKIPQDMIYRADEFFRVQKNVGQDLIQELALYDESFIQLGNFYFAKNSMSEEEFISFYKSQYESYSKDVKDFHYVTRSIASLKEKNKLK